MSALRLLPVSLAALALLGCASTAAPPQAGTIARLTPEELARTLPRSEPELPTAELIRRSKAGEPAKDIIARIQRTGSRYDLSASQLIALHVAGVSAEVLNYIQSAREQELLSQLAEEINQREQRHAEELRRERELRGSECYCDPWWPGYPGYGWRYGHPFRPYGGIRIR